MARIVFTSRFKRDYKRLKRKHYKMEEINYCIKLLAQEDFEQLTNKYDNHQLHGKWAKYSAIHIESNWVLIYKKRKDGRYDLLVIDLIATGNHEEYKKQQQVS